MSVMRSRIMRTMSKPRMTICPTCEGVGLMPAYDAMICPVCDGMGEVSYRSCDRCGGQGRVPRHAEVLCDTCKGVGYVRDGKTFPTE